MPNKSERAKFVKDTVNKVIPRILNSNIVAKAAIAKTELLHYPHNVGNKSSTKSSKRGKAKEPMEDEIDSQAATLEIHKEIPATALEAPRIEVIQSDTFDAAQNILSSIPPKSRVAILNMASPLRPGGGFLKGATAQEEALCGRSTLYAAIVSDETFYRLPSLSAIYSPDILVFRSADGVELPKSEHFFVDVITAAAVRKPDLVSGSTVEGQVQLRYEDGDREEMTLKVRALFHFAREKCVTHLVLGAWGCGAYGNPPQEVARIFKTVLLGDRRRKGVWEGSGLVSVVFAIHDRGPNLRAFENEFGRLETGVEEDSGAERSQES
ncbi:hypothetical protein BJ875DRAFT_450998 [Amylocarpus encephaloides]|uniref:Microbial-type PARG catalytic domain-containing protein n=1 Tax=Amylocarpus encephaloides TaxID=45428 RepID=A0A9P8CAV2_9HELO|nr:hypothetical protein BJ875DRAFT_450998 [Amylocarpus encephaloides]